MQARLALVTSAPAPSAAARRRSLVRFLGVELALSAAAYTAYLAVRGHADPADAADLRERLEEVVVAGIAVWLGFRHRAVYCAYRRALLLSIAMATVVFVTFPTAPPRLASLSILDTVGLSGHDTGSFMGIRFDPYAAVPSMHVGWSLLVAWFGLQVVSGRIPRLLLAAHPVLMAVTVTVTGNHFFFDAITGAAVALVALALLRLVPRPRRRPSLRLVPADAADPAHEGDARRAA
jgi:hypothetical protein